MEALLALGRHAEVIAELEGLIFSYPHRERLRQTARCWRCTAAAGRRRRWLSIARRVGCCERAGHRARPRAAPAGGGGAPPRQRPRRAVAARCGADSGPDERKLATALVAELVVAGEIPSASGRAWSGSQWRPSRRSRAPGAGSSIRRAPSSWPPSASRSPARITPSALSGWRSSWLARNASGLASIPARCCVSGSDLTPLLIVGDAVQLALALAHTAVSGEVLVGQRCRAIAERGFEWDGRRLLRAVYARARDLSAASAPLLVVRQSWRGLPRLSP